MFRESGPVIQISAEVRAGLKSAADAGLRTTARRVETGGILTAPLNGGHGLVVDGIEMVPCDHQYGPAYHLSPGELDRMRDQAERIRTGGRRKIAGYFHTCMGDRFSPFPDDQVVVREILPESQFILLVKALPPALFMARLFERNAAGAWVESAHFELPSLVASAVQPSVPQPAGVSSAATAPKLSWVSMAGGIVVVALLIATWYQSRPKPMLTSPAATLGMRVNPQGKSFYVIWDRTSPAAKWASDGVLRIVDGGQHRDILLDPTQIQTGSIVYRPASDDVTFSLEIFRNGVTVAHESVRALDGLRSEAAEQEPPIPDPKPSRLAMARTPVEKQPVAPEPAAARSTQPETPRPAATAPPMTIPPAQPLAAPPVPQPTVTPNKAAAIPAEVLPASSSKPQVTGEPLPGKPAPADPKVVAAAAVSPTVTRGDPQSMVMPGPAVAGPIVTAAKPVRKFVPNTRNLGPAPLFGPAEIEVQVSIDIKGHVTGARAVDSGKKVNQVLLGQALEAAKKWTFEPATDRGKAVPSTHLITFRFVPGS